jgi:hypothetical protein
MEVQEGWDNDVICSLRKKQLAIFYGAGISIPSGVPSANAIGTHIISCVFGNRTDLSTRMSEIYLKQNFPFEALMDTLSTVSDITPLFELFKLGKPNAYHILIAQLAAKGYLKYVITPNFDELLEQALDKYNVNFRQIYDISDNSWLADSNNAQFFVVKIHGTVSDPQGIITTLNSLTEKKSYQPRLKLLNSFLSIGSYNQILVLGYSGSDELDVNIVLQAANKLNKKLTVVRHSQYNKLAISQLIYPYDKLDGIIVTGKTEAILKNILSQVFEKEAEEFKIIAGETGTAWKLIIDNWAKSISEEKIKHLRFILMAAITNYHHDMDGIYTGSGFDQPRSRIVRTYHTLGHAYMMGHCPRRGAATLIHGADMAHAIGDFPHEWWMYYRLSFYSKIGKQLGAHAFCAKKMLELTDTYKNLKFFSFVSSSRASRPLLDTFQVLGEAYLFAGDNEIAYNVLWANTVNMATEILASNQRTGWSELITNLLQLGRVCIRLKKTRQAYWCFLTACRLGLKYGYLKEMVQNKFLENANNRRHAEFTFLSKALNAETFRLDVVRKPPLSLNEDALISYWEPNLQKKDIILISQALFRKFFDGRMLTKKEIERDRATHKEMAKEDTGASLRTSVIIICPFCGKELASQSDLNSIVSAGRPRAFDSNETRLKRIKRKSEKVFKKNEAARLAIYFPTNPVIIKSLDYHSIIYPICQNCKFHADLVSQEELGAIMVRIRKEFQVGKG